MSISIGHLRFIDSMQLMASSLEKLAEDLYDSTDKFKNFTHMKRFFSDKMDLVCQKGHFPYEWFDSIDKFDYKGLPPIEACYSQLHLETKSKKEPAHALNV